MQKILWVAAIVSLTTACWEPITFIDDRHVPEAARGQAVHELEAKLAGKKKTEASSTTSSTPAQAKPAATGAPAPPADAKLRTVEVTAEAAARGQASFAMCVGCHGAEADGRVGIAPRLASPSFLAAASDRMLFETIKNGRPGTTMVPWGAALKDPQIHDIIAWLRTKTKTEPVKLDDSPVKGDAVAGGKLFREICAACHGRSGAGYQESGSGTGIGRKAFMSTATNGFLRYLIKHGKSQTPMRPFAEGAPAAVANLKTEEIENLIAYMRKSAW